MNKSTLVVAGTITFVLLLAGAAFAGVRLLNGQGLLRLSEGPHVFTSGGKTSIEVNPGDVQPAAELPQMPADVEGIFDHRQDNSIFVGTGNVTMTVQKDKFGKVKTFSSHSGPVIEVVVMPQTVIYKDVTDQQFNNKPPVSHQKIQQVVETGSLDEIGQSSNIAVWGRQTGHRTFAEILLYTGP